MTGLSGSLLSLDVLRTLALESNARVTAVRARVTLTGAFRAVGPASGARTVLDAEAIPLLRALGFDVTLTRDSSEEIGGILQKDGRPAANLTVGAWGSDLWRLGAVTAPKREARLRWSVAINGAMLRLADRARAYARRALDVDLQRAEQDEATLGVLARLFEADEEGRLANLDRCVLDSDAHRAAVGSSLQTGVEQALGHLIAALTPRRRRHRAALDEALADALTIVYRILFLLFAEARGLVPDWHPIYRNSYTVEALRPRIERVPRPPGVWQALQAISRLAHRGCRAGTLRVTPFNGRLFAPGAAPLAESAAIDDRRIREVLLAITTRPAKDRRERIAYTDLGVEQLGAVYERVLDYSPEIVDGTAILTRSGRRKATGTFYTPRSMTDYLVRRTLAPLVRNRSAEGVLQLRILDPAMGSGAFLVSACRYLADAYEQALVREGTLPSASLAPSDRAIFRRAIAQRCLYGVDRNPTAVQLARLSLWLCTLAADRPLTFLDHHLRVGNSLVGAAPRDIMRQPPGLQAGRRANPPSALPLFEDIGLLHERIGAVVGPRIAMAAEEDDTAEVVRRKERTLASLEGAGAPLEIWRSLADAWCAAWFWPPAVDRPTATAWGALRTALRAEASGLPSALEHTWLGTIRDLSAQEKFLHWELEFPEVFFDSDGCALERAGFDAVIGNPPWDTLRESNDAPDSLVTPRSLTRFSRDSGCYRLQGNGHANLYQLFAERAIQLAKPEGRLGLLMPSGLLSDHGCVGLRRALFDACRIDAILSFDNRHAIFPIHRGVRFVLLTAQTGGGTHDVRTVFGLHSPKLLEDVPDEGDIDGSLGLPIALVRKFTGPDFALPELQSDLDRQIVAVIVSSAPPLGDEEGWQCRFGRELNASDDRRHFTHRGLPVLEGKLLNPFRVNVSDAKSRISRTAAARLLGDRAAFDRPRLGYREVAASTNRLTLIAAMIPAGTVTTHTVFCLKGDHDLELQWFLCGIFNSFVANYLVRLRGGTHVTASMMIRLPVPKPARESEDFTRIAALARALTADDDAEAQAELQARAARLYRIDRVEFAHVLSTFPLVARDVRDASATAFQLMTDAV